MDATPNLNLPFIMAAQAQKHVTHNEALRALDAIVQLVVADKDLSTPPGSPTDGACYIVAASPTDAWSGQAGNIAAWQDGAWAFYAPREGWLAWVADETTLYVWNGSAWAVFAGGGLADLVEDATPQLGGDLDANGHGIGFDDGTGLTDDAGNAQLVLHKTASAVNRVGLTNAATGSAPLIAAEGSDTDIDLTLAGKGTGHPKAALFGVNATADATTKFVVAAAASLFNHAGTGHQHKINKAAAGDTASLLFQTASSGRAEMGLAGDDDFHVKVSPDGSTWHEALVIDRATGQMSASQPGVPAKFVNTTDQQNNAALELHSDRATATNGDLSGLAFYLSDSVGSQHEFARISGRASAVANGSEAGALVFSVAQPTLANKMQLNTSAMHPWVSDGLALGTVSNMWADLFLASGGVINWNNGNFTLTHSSGLLTLSGPMASPSYLEFTAMSAPASPASGKLRVYAKDSGGGVIKLYTKDSAGTETELG
jgi:hypothetical protein